MGHDLRKIKWGHSAEEILSLIRTQFIKNKLAYTNIKNFKVTISDAEIIEDTIDWMTPSGSILKVNNDCILVKTGNINHLHLLNFTIFDLDTGKKVVILNNELFKIGNMFE